MAGCVPPMTIPASKSPDSEGFLFHQLAIAASSVFIPAGLGVIPA